jgi:hypothetical protein
VWAANAAGAYIRTVPVNSQIGIQDGAASFTDGFVPDNFTTLAAGGVPPFGQDFNGLLKVETSWTQWFQARGPISYDSAFATANGGYPQSAILDSVVVFGAQWLNAVDSNTTDPDDPLTSVGWLRMGLQPGMLMPFLTAAPDQTSGFVTANGTTIGNAASNATVAAQATIFLYAANWLQFSNTQCPILTSAGAPSTRGANPYADFAANKQLTMPNMKGLGILGVDGMGAAASTFLTGVPVTIGNSTTRGSILGENLHALINAELSAHTHVNTLTDNNHTHGYTSTVSSGVQANAPPGGILLSQTGASTSTPSTVPMSIINASVGSGTAHNTVGRNMLCYWGQKL